MSTNASTITNMKGKNTTEQKRKSTNKATKRQRQQPNMVEGVEKLLKSSRCPLFLRKTYCMIDSCDSDAIEWSSDGKYFIIKNQDDFVTSIIPRYFKHNNLQSFVRQLNFYGFRKIKTDHIAFGTSTKNTSRYLCFQHEQFVRGHPELLLQIRKPCQKVPSSQKQVEYLKNEVQSLKKTISTMAGEIETLTKLAMELVTRLERDAKHENEMYDDFNKKTKKRKVTEKPTFTSTATHNNLVQTPINRILIRKVSDDKQISPHEIPTHTKMRQRHQQNDSDPALNESDTEFDHEPKNATRHSTVMMQIFVRVSIVSRQVVSFILNTLESTSFKKALLIVIFFQMLILLFLRFSSQIKGFIFPVPLPTEKDVLSSISRWNDSVEKIESKTQPIPGPIPRHLYIMKCNDNDMNYHQDWDETTANCKRNVQKIIDAYHSAFSSLETSSPEVTHLDDNVCLTYIRNVEPKLVEPFNVEFSQDHKDNMCRVAILFLYGGYYIQNDLEVLKPVIPDDDITFVTALEETGEGFFQPFIAATPHHPIFGLALKNMVKYYEKAFNSGNGYGGFIEQGYTDKMREHDPGWNFGTRMLKKAFAMLPLHSQGKTLILQEIHLNDDHRNWYPHLKRRESPNELCCCNFAIHNPKTKVVHFWSRFVGSKFC